MPSTYSPDLRIELIGNGQQTGIWGNTTNNNLGTLLEQAIAGLANIYVQSAKYPLTAREGVTDESRCAALNITTDQTSDIEIYVPPVSKLYAIRNATNVVLTVYASNTLGSTTAGGTGIAIPKNKSVLVRCDGTNILEQLNQVVGTFDVEGMFSAATDAAVTGSLTVSGSAYLGAPQGVDITPGSPGVFETTILPLNGIAVTFSTSDTLPDPLTAGTMYYTVNRNTTLNTFNVSTTPNGSGLAVTSTGSGVWVMTSVSQVATPAKESNSTQIANTEYVTRAINNALPDVQVRAYALVATTAPITLSGTQTIDGVAVVAEDRVLVKNQAASSQTVTITIDSPALFTVATPLNNGDMVQITTTGALPTGLSSIGRYYVVNATSTTFNLALTPGGIPLNTSGTQSGIQTVNVQPAATNGLYVVKADAWVRATDMDTAAKAAAAMVPVLKGSVNGGKTFLSEFKSTDTLGSSTMYFSQVQTATSSNTLANKTIDAAQIFDASITPGKLTGGQTGAAPIYGVRAWANMNGLLGAVTTLNGSFVRLVSSTTCTVTQLSHGFKPGQVVYITFSATVTSDWYVIQTVPDANTFTVTTGATTAAVGTTIIRKMLINASGNIANAIYGGVGGFAINFAVDMQDVNYSFSGAVGYGGVGQSAWLGSPINTAFSSWKSTKFLRFGTFYANAAYSTADPIDLSIQIIR